MGAVAECGVVSRGAIVDTRRARRANGDVAGVIGVRAGSGGEGIVALGGCAGSDGDGVASGRGCVAAGRIGLVILDRRAGIDRVDARRVRRNVTVGRTKLIAVDRLGAAGRGGAGRDIDDLARVRARTDRNGVGDIGHGAFAQRHGIGGRAR